MASLQTQRHCKSCGRKTLHARDTFGAGWGCLLSVLTLGVFAVTVWPLVAVYEAAFVPWRCQACGRGRSL